MTSCRVQRVRYEQHMEYESNCSRSERWCSCLREATVDWLGTWQENDK
jgi:hypothetical protein